MGWGSGPAKGGLLFQNMSFCDVTSRNPPTESENCFFDFDNKTCWIRRGFEQLFSSIAWRVIGLQNFTRKVAHAGLRGFLRKLLCVRHWVPQVICILWGATSLKWLGSTGLTKDPSSDGCACDTKSGVTNMRSTKEFRAAREAFRWDQQVLLSFVVCFYWLTTFSFSKSIIVWLKSCAARLLSGNWQSGPR